MVRLAFVISVIALFACSGSDDGQTTDTGGAQQVGADEMERTAAPKALEPAATTAVDPKVESCLDLIRQAKFQQALPVCLAALAIDPDNQQVRDAVDQARAETAKLAAAEAAGGAAVEGAADEASSKLGEATGGMADKLGQ
jgi:hypothetical protein